MTKEIAVPDYLRSMVQESEDTGNQLVTSAGSSFPRISLKGRQFRFIKDGEEVFKTPNPIDVVIIGVQPEQGMAKTYYLNGYQPGDTSPPDCSSQDGVRPDAWVSSPISPNCATCPQNKWGSATSITGKKAKACKDSKRLLVTVPKDPGNAALYLLNVTVSSLKALSEYGKQLVANKVPISAAITTVSMVDADFPQIEFSFKTILPEDQCKAAVARNRTREWESDYTQAAIAHSAQDQESLPAPGQQQANNPNVDETKKIDNNADDILSEWG